MSDSREALIGFEVLRLDEHDERAPWRMTVDAFIKDGEGERIVRYQLSGMHYERRDRTLDEIARVQGQFSRREEIADRFDALDREAGAKMAEVTHWLKREQARVLYGDHGVAFFDGEVPA